MIDRVENFPFLVLKTPPAPPHHPQIRPLDHSFKLRDTPVGERKQRLERYSRVSPSIVHARLLKLRQREEIFHQPHLLLFTLSAISVRAHNVIETTGRQ